MSAGAVYGVFDIDSPRRGRFAERDADGVARLVAQFVAHTPLPERYRRVPAASGINQRIDVQTCRDHHVVLRYLIEEIDKEERPANARALLGRFRSVLLAHLKLEDDWLYPRLARSETSLVRSKAERYQREMGGLRGAFDDLWDAWSEQGAIDENAARWQEQWRRFRERLEARITTEDADLYATADTSFT